MNQQLNEIKEALKAATPGPWVIAPDRTISGLYDIGGRYGLTAQTDHSDNATLIANAPTWLASLVSQVEEMQKTLEFYANALTYDIEHLSKHGYIVIDRDGGKLARNTLQSLKGDKP